MHNTYSIFLRIILKFWWVQIFIKKKNLSRNYLINIMIISIHQTRILMYSRCSSINDSLGGCHQYWKQMKALLNFLYNALFWWKILRNYTYDFSFLCYCMTKILVTLLLIGSYFKFLGALLHLRSLITLWIVFS